MFENQLPGIKGHQRSGEGLRVHPLNDRIGPIDLRYWKSDGERPRQVSSRRRVSSASDRLPVVQGWPFWELVGAGTRCSGGLSNLILLRDVWCQGCNSGRNSGLRFGSRLVVVRPEFWPFAATHWLVGSGEFDAR